MEALRHELRRLTTGKALTTAIDCRHINTIHELLWHKAIIHYPRATAPAGKTIIGIGARKGTKSKIALWLKTGTIDLR